MGKGKILCLMLCFQLFLTTGCWDRKELNDRAIWLATGWDVGEKDELLLSGQLAIPSNMQTQAGGGGGGGKGEEFITVAAKGKNARDSLENMQSQLTREAFLGQRRVVLYGEEFARRGIKWEIDANARGSDVGIRTDVFVVKGDTALHALNLSNPLEKPPAVAMLKAHEQAGGRVDTTYLDFIIAANSDGIRPTLPAVEIGYIQNGSKNAQGAAAKPILKLAGLAVFDKDLTMLGFLNMDENQDFLWVRGNLKKKLITISLDEGKGNASLDLVKIKGKITPKIDRTNRVTFTVELSGEGEVSEYNSNQNLDNAKNIAFLEKEMERQTKEKVHGMIKKVQEEYGVDIFGFGEALHNSYPQQWKKVKDDWDSRFVEADISVKVDLNITRVGMSGPSFLFKESEIKK